MYFARATRGAAFAGSKPSSCWIASFIRLSATCSAQGQNSHGDCQLSKSHSSSVPWRVSQTNVCKNHMCGPELTGRNVPHTVECSQCRKHERAHANRNRPNLMPDIHNGKVCDWILGLHAPPCSSQYPGAWGMLSCCWPGPWLLSCPTPQCSG